MLYNEWKDVYVHRTIKHGAIEFLKSDLYEICFLDSKEGCHIRNKKTVKILKPSKGPSGLQDQTVTLRINKSFIKYSLTHVMLASAQPDFPPPPEKGTVDHIDNDYTNNNISNLQWMSLTENCKKLAQYRDPKPDLVISIPLDEVWKPFSLDNGKIQYQISNYGRMKTPLGLITIGTPLRGYKRRQCNIRFMIDENNMKSKKLYIHQLVWRAFSGVAENGLDVMHDDSAPLQSDGTYRNWFKDLSLGTRSENMISFHEHKNTTENQKLQADLNEKQTAAVIVKPRQRYANESINLDLPTGFWIQKPYLNKGEVIVIDIKRATKNGTHLHWKSPSCRDMNINLKVEIAKKFVRWVTHIHPEVAQFCNMKACEMNLEGLSQYEIDTLHRFELNEKQNDPFKPKDANHRKSTQSRLPTDCGVVQQDIPKYVYYIPESDKRGDQFVIDKHPLLIKKLGKKTWATTGSKLVTTKKKFESLVEMLQSLEA